VMKDIKSMMSSKHTWSNIELTALEW
jgi:hypothetical protein